jgi:hypothetical protein
MDQLPGAFQARQCVFPSRSPRYRTVNVDVDAVAHGDAVAGRLDDGTLLSQLAQRRLT